MIQATNLVYRYPVWEIEDNEQPETNDSIEQQKQKDDREHHGINGISLHVKQGEFVAVLGRNGSGKSTLAKLLKLVVHPQEGTLFIDGVDASLKENKHHIHHRLGMVFQNPDNQIVASVVEKEVGFGPENLEIPSEKILPRVKAALQAVNMLPFAKSFVNKLSGGQKQRVCIAGVLAMKPKCMVTDEATAMLDPAGRKKILENVYQLNQEEGMSVIYITHYMEEVVKADRVLVLDKGKIVMEGTPGQIFSKVEQLEECQLEVPRITKLAYELKKRGMPLSEGILTMDELMGELLQLMQPKIGKEYTSKIKAAKVKKEAELQIDFQNENPAVQIEHLSFTYSYGTKMEKTALKDVSLEIPKGQFVGIIGQTGSGKTTLVKHLIGLLDVQRGRVVIEGQNVTEDKEAFKHLRGKVGYVFQYPEYQLFETSVLADVMAGPKNMGMSQEEAKKSAVCALEQMKISEEYYEQSPFDLSGGQKRKVAVAGILAMNPDIFILDEPAAGLDPVGKRELFELLEKLCYEKNITIIVVSHSMEDMAEYAQRILVMHEGEVALDGTPKEVFSHGEELEEMGLDVVQGMKVIGQLQENGIEIDIESCRIMDIAEAISNIYDSEWRKG